MKKSKILKTFIAIILLIGIETSAIAVTTGVVNTDTVRVRAKATTDSGIVALVSIGDKITITGVEDNWYKVQVQDEEGKTVTGYIRNDLLTVKEPITSNEISDQPTGNEGDGNSQVVENNGDNSSEVVDNDGENNSEEPNNNGQVDENTTPGNEENPEEGETIETSREVVGSVKKDDREISTIKKSANLSEGQTIQLAENIKVKIIPSANSSNIAELQANTTVTVLQVINNWCRIETEGACGWVRIDQ